MTYRADMIADSVSPEGARIMTLALRYPRFILAEFNTHRMLSRNSSSSRAIPVKKLIEDCKFDPVDPVYWGRNQKGMQARLELDDMQKTLAMSAWRSARDTAIIHAEKLAQIGAHKQIVNRVIEPFAHTETVATGTYRAWLDFDILRNHEDAQPEIRELAQQISKAIATSNPRLIAVGEWHTPYVPASVTTLGEKLVCSAARCARVSYKNHDGTTSDLGNDQRLAERLQESGHWSPFEHQATPDENCVVGNLKGWRQLRHTLRLNT